MEAKQTPRLHRQQALCETGRVICQLCIRLYILPPLLCLLSLIVQVEHSRSVGQCHGPWDAEQDPSLRCDDEFEPQGWKCLR